jgi:enterochelin esterase-like enzyme
VPYDDDWIRANFGSYQPKAAEFADFIVKEVVPYVDQKFRTLADRENRAINRKFFARSI